MRLTKILSLNKETEAELVDYMEGIVERDSVCKSPVAWVKAKSTDDAFAVYVQDMQKEMEAEELKEFQTYKEEA